MQQLSHILITHYVDDHIGSLSEFKANYPQVRIVASEIEAPFIRGERKPERLVQAENLLEQLSGTSRNWTACTGDAAVNDQEQLVVANPQYCLDLVKAEQSLRTLQDLHAAHYYCYHGGKWRSR